jgi:hypothetical protein
VPPLYQRSRSGDHALGRTLKVIDDFGVRHNHRNRSGVVSFIESSWE